MAGGKNKPCETIENRIEPQTPKGAFDLCKSIQLSSLVQHYSNDGHYFKSSSELLNTPFREMEGLCLKII